MQKKTRLETTAKKLARNIGVLTEFDPYAKSAKYNPVIEKQVDEDGQPQNTEAKKDSRSKFDKKFPLEK